MYATAQLSLSPGQETISVAPGPNGPAEPDPDASLVVRLQQGDLGAFELLVDKYKQGIINFASRTLGDRFEAEDIAQNAFVRAFKASGRFRFGARFSSWLYTITRNLCLNELRRRSRHQATGLRDQQEESAEAADWHCGVFATPPEALCQQELLERLERGLAALPEPQRTAILLLREDMSYREIAGVLGMSVPATKSVIHRGRQALRRSLRPEPAARPNGTEPRTQRKPARACLRSAVGVRPSDNRHWQQAHSIARGVQKSSARLLFAA